MRDQIIKYLQGIQCEWFPVEWDSFVYNFMGIQLTYSESDLCNFRIKYEFFDNFYNVLFSQYRLNSNLKEYNVMEFHSTCNYFTLDRCKTILLNAVRSVDEPKRIAAGEIIKQYQIGIDESDIMVFVAYNNCSGDMVWQNGEFK